MSQYKRVISETPPLPTGIWKSEYHAHVARVPLMNWYRKEVNPLITLKVMERTTKLIFHLSFDSIRQFPTKLLLLVTSYLYQKYY